MMHIVYQIQSLLDMNYAFKTVSVDSQGTERKTQRN